MFGKRLSQLFGATCSLFVWQAASQNIMLLNDIHLNIDSTAEVVLPGKETSPDMLNLVLGNAVKFEEKIGSQPEAILLIGDLVKHGLAAYPGQEPVNWPKQKETMRQVIASIVANFPDTPILPVIGNNDVIYHD
jgi:hypothetical protein